MKFYTESIVQTINNYLLCDCISFQFDEAEGLFSFGRKLKTSLTQARIEIEAGVEEFTVSAILPVRGDNTFGGEELCRFFGMINHYSRAAVFEIDPESGEIRCRCWCCCAGLAAPSEKMVKNALEYVLEACEKYGDGIVKVLFSHYPPEMAIRSCTCSADEDGEEEAQASEPRPQFPGGFDPFEDMDLFEEFEDSRPGHSSHGFDLERLLHSFKKNKGRNRRYRP